MCQATVAHNMRRNLCHGQWKQTATCPRDTRTRSTVYTRCPDPNLTSNVLSCLWLWYFQCCVSASVCFVMEWSKCKVAKLIELYEQETVLWNITNSSHKNSNNRNDALQRISDVMECTIADVEKKLHSLRSQYLREKTKIEKSKKSGAGAKDIYVPKWQYFSLLSFLSTTTERVAHTSSLNLVSK